MHAGAAQSARQPQQPAVRKRTLLALAALRVAPLHPHDAAGVHVVQGLTLHTPQTGAYAAALIARKVGSSFAGQLAHAPPRPQALSLHAAKEQDFQSIIRAHSKRPFGGIQKLKRGHIYAPPMQWLPVP